MQAILHRGRPGLLARLRALLLGEPDVEATDPLADAELVMRQHGSAILRLAYSYLREMGEAEDVLQDTLLRYLQKAPRFASAAHEKAWLLRVAANLSKNRLSYRQRHPQQELDENLPIPESNGEESLVWECVHVLPVAYREVVHLYYYEEYTTREIAGILDRREATVRSQLFRAREKLRQMLKEEYDFEE